MFRVIGRLKPGVTQERAEAELDATMRQFNKDFGEDDQAVKGRRVMLAMGGKSLVIRKQDLPFFTAVLHGDGGTGAADRLLERRRT